MGQEHGYDFVERAPRVFVAVTTSNLDDVDNITEPLIGRLTNLFVPFNHDHGKNRAIVDRGIGTTNLLVPAIIREAAVHLTESWRRTSEAVPEFYEVGSNRTMIDLVRRAEAYALLAGRSGVAGADFEDAARDVMRGRIRARGGEAFMQNVQVVDAFLQKHGKAALRTAAEQAWCRFFVEDLNRDKGEAFRVVQDVRASLARGVDGLAASLSTNGKANKFADHVARHELRLGRAPDAQDKARGTQAVFRLFDDAGLFDERGPKDEAWAAAEKYLAKKP
jgi:histone H3/H4